MITSGSPIIDVHMHPDRSRWPELEPSAMVEWLAAKMDRAGVSMGGLLGVVDPGQDAHRVAQGNDYTAEMVAIAPERFFGFCFINPAVDTQEIERELERCLSQPGFIGIKLEIDVNARDARLAPVMEAARAWNCPVLHHSWYLNLWNTPEQGRIFQKNRSEPHDIAALARAYPDVRFIMAHLEGCGIRGILDVAPLSNIWIDTSGSQPFTGTMEYALKAIGADRILFGSDLCFRGYGSQLGRVIGCRMTPAEREKILYRNTAKLFGLPFPGASTGRAKEALIR